VSVPEAPPPRFAELVVVSPAGVVIGSLPPIPVRTPWWPEAAPIVEAARDRFGLEIVVLRILDSEPDSPPGGRVTYLVETRDPVPGAEPWGGTLSDHPLRMPWARPGGPTADIAWADGVLASHGRARTGPAQQIRTWNLSSLWRLPESGGFVWLKHVPPFFDHESSVIELLAGRAVPKLIGADGGRSLLEEIRGEDLYDAGVGMLEPAVSMLVGIQADLAGRIDDLLALGLPDWRGRAVAESIRAVIDRTVAELSIDDIATLRAFADDLPRRFDEIDACGIPDSIVHGDFAPGNLRGDGSSLVLLDWGDSGVGHPLLDVPAMIDRAPPDAADALHERWTAEWQSAMPGSDPRRAAALLGPVGAARQAVIYRKFLDNIEPTEYPYHRKDPADWLRRTVSLLRSEPATDGRIR
jgi:hypothetical protein